jgi:WD40 repeat protein
MSSISALPYDLQSTICFQLKALPDLHTFCMVNHYWNHIGSKHPLSLLFSRMTKGTREPHFQPTSHGRISSVALYKKYLCVGDTNIAANSHTVVVYDLDKKCPLYSIMGHSKPIRYIHIRGERIFTGSLNGTTRVSDLKTGEEVSTFWTSNATSDPDGHNLWTLQADEHYLCTGASDGTVAVWNLDHPHKSYTFRAHHSCIHHMQLGGERLLTVSQAGDLSVWDLEKHSSALRTYEKLTAAISCAQMHGNHFSIGLRNGVVMTGRSDTGDILHTHQNYTKAVSHLEFNEKFLCTSATKEMSYANPKNGSAPQNDSVPPIIVRDLRTGEIRYKLTDYKGSISCLKLHEYLLLTGSASGIVTVWNLIRGEKIGCFEIGKASIQDLHVEDNLLCVTTRPTKVSIMRLEVPPL